MPVYNSEEFLAEAIESILAQTFTDFELLIVDDGSQDRSPAISRAYAEKDRRVYFHALESNRGRADAANVGIAAACGAYITRMDSDDISDRERLAKQVAFLRVNPAIGAVGVGGSVRTRDMKTELAQTNLPAQHALIALDWFILHGVLGATVMYRQEFLRTIGGYEPGRRACDDVELLARLLSDTSIRLANLPQLLYLYRRHEQVKFRDPDALPHTELRRLKVHYLRQMGVEDPASAAERLSRLRRWRKLPWRQRRAVKHDLMQLFNGMVEQRWVAPSDRALLEAEMHDILEHTSPRWWLKCLYWYRYRIKRHLPGRAG